MIPKHKTVDCSRCPATGVAGRKRGKEYLCLQCCNKDDVLKQMNNAKRKHALKKDTGKIKALGLKQDISFTDKLKVAVRSQELEEWFKLIKGKLIGVCQCGCGNKSQKNDNKYFKYSCCHIFPKFKFESIRTHPLNYVERAFWGGCHGVLDDTSMDRWPNMADWDDIKAKFFVLAPLLTDEEKSSKFYSHLERLVLSN